VLGEGAAHFVAVRAGRARRNAILLCATGEEKIARFDLIVAGEAGFHERFAPEGLPS
jgi:hypothetical protein